MKFLIDETPKKVTDCRLTSYETVFGKNVLVCKLSNNECKLCKNKPCDQLVSLKDYMNKPIVGIEELVIKEVN